MKKQIPSYDICQIDSSVHRDLLVQRFGKYLDSHYASLSRPHRHSFYHLVFFTHGRGNHTIDFSTYPVKPHQLYFMSPGQVHSWHFEGDVDGYIVNFNAELFSSFLQRANHIAQYPFFQGDGVNGVINVPIQLQTKIASLFEDMLKEMDEGRSNLNMIRVLLLQLFIHVERCCTKNINRNVPQQKLVMVNHFRQLIDSHFRSIRLPKEYAGLMYITPNYLNALCQDVFGRAAGEMIRDRILLEAKRLLTNADMDIAEVAYDLNFHDNSYFTRFFKKNTGLTPEEFRKEIVEEKIEDNGK